MEARSESVFGVHLESNHAMVRLASLCSAGFPLDIPQEFCQTPLYNPQGG
jgi:hypothetical protein